MMGKEESAVEGGEDNLLDLVSQFLVRDDDDPLSVYFDFKQIGAGYLLLLLPFSLFTSLYPLHFFLFYSLLSHFLSVLLERSTKRKRSNRSAMSLSRR